MAKIILDALIPREDFEVQESTSSGSKKGSISIEDIKPDSFFFTTVRKPDFQRETNEWDSDKIVQLIESFLDGDLIPAIILWRSPSGFLFVIDGSHRLSTLSAWLNNDYGDGEISRRFYDGEIPQEQKAAADQVRKRIQAKIGSYADYIYATKNPNSISNDNIARRVKNLAALAIQLQWVEGDASKAESSFFKINQQSAKLDKTELQILKTRNRPNSIAARAVIRSGKGHKYWSSFDKDIQNKIQDLAQEIHTLLFKPSLKTPIKTLSIPIAGKLNTAQTLPLVLEFINISNGNIKDLKNDLSGSETVKMLKNSLKVLHVINSSHPSSLGLHPAIYFYAIDGRHKIASFFSFLKFSMELEKRKKKNLFIKNRAEFEKFITYHDSVIQEINRKYRSAINSYKHISDFLMTLLDLLDRYNVLEKAISEFKTDPKLKAKYSYLTFSNQDFTETSSKEFNSSRKSAVFLKDAIENSQRCAICNGLIHQNSISIDHIERKEDGGLGTISNGQLSHPYCNTSYKN